MMLTEVILVLGLTGLIAGAGAEHAAAGSGEQGRAARARKRPPKQPQRRSDERLVPAMQGNLPNVRSPGALVLDLASGRELYGRKADETRAIASVSKLAAALVMVDRGFDPDGLQTINKTDAQVARGGAPSRLLEGMTLSNRDLLHAALMGSDNRAVSALGRSVGLSAAELAQAMNRKVGQLGLKHTRFSEPTGLAAANVSTPRESIALLRAAMAHATLGPILRRIEYDARPSRRPAIKYVNTHRPAARSNTEVLGGKTGFNAAARYCLVLVARIDGRSYGMAFLGSDGKLTRFGDVARVADWIVARVAQAPHRIAAPFPATSGRQPAERHRQLR